nr:hypothetical protein [Tanacetum cinerariifolium]
VEVVYDHLLRYGFLSGYTIWTIHGELATPPTSQSTSVHETSFVEDDVIDLDKNEGEQFCHICKTSQYKSDGDELGKSSNSHKSKKPAKVLCYFPLILRLKKLYMCETTLKDMRWYDMGQTKDGKLRHPGDGLALKAFNDRYLKFASDPRSVRLGLASDGCNHFRTMNTTHSTGPVLLIPYNLPSWICMKQQSFILLAIIQGEKGWSTKERVACPTCVNSTCSMWLKHGNKFCNMGHHRWLEENHPYQFQKDRFDSTIERKFSLPQVSDLDDVLFAMFAVKVIYTKHRFKMKLSRLATKKLDEPNNVGANGEQERTYTDDELLQALDLIDEQPNFLHHQWELYKSNLITPLAKKLSQQGKKAKSMKIHTHTTCATSFARKRDRFLEASCLAYLLPQVSDLDDVLFAMFTVKVRYTKHRFKMKLFRLATKKLDEPNNVGANGEQERTYTDDELL